jgi:hypothetical protein
MTVPRLPAMHDLQRVGRATTALLLLTLVLAACGGAAASSAPPSADPSPDAPVVTDPPAGDSGGDDGSGGVPPADGAKVVTPRPGQLDVHPVSAETLRATVDGRSVVVAVDWWSGVEPCTILDTIVVERGDGSFAITLHEGRGPEDVACIAIAELHRAFIDLGELEPGTYAIRDATGGAPDIEVVVG